MSVVVVKIELAGAVSRVQPFAFGVSFADRRGGGSFRQAEKAMVPQSALRADLSENPLILLAERQTSKLMTRVRFPSPAPAFRAQALRLAGRPRRPPAEAVHLLQSSRVESMHCYDLIPSVISGQSRNTTIQQTSVLHFAVVAGTLDSRKPNERRRLNGRPTPRPRGGQSRPQRLSHGHRLEAPSDRSDQLGRRRLAACSYLTLTVDAIGRKALRG
jgi:hypothetical protein